MMRLKEASSSCERADAYWISGYTHGSSIIHVSLGMVMDDPKRMHIHAGSAFSKTKFRVCANKYCCLTRSALFLFKAVESLDSGLA